MMRRGGTPPTMENAIEARAAATVEPLREGTHLYHGTTEASRLRAMTMGLMPAQETNAQGATAAFAQRHDVDPAVATRASQHVYATARKDVAQRYAARAASHTEDDTPALVRLYAKDRGWEDDADSPLADQAHRTTRTVPTSDLRRGSTESWASHSSRDSFPSLSTPPGSAGSSVSFSTPPDSPRDTTAGRAPFRYYAKAQYAQTNARIGRKGVTPSRAPLSHRKDEG